MRFKSFWLTGLVFFAIAAIAGLSAGATAANNQAPTTQDSRDLADAAWRDSHDLERAGKLDEAIVKAREVVALDAITYGDISDISANAQEWLGNLLEDKNDWAAARAARQNVLDVRTILYGATSIPAVNARVLLENIIRTAAMTPQELELRKKERAMVEEGVVLFREAKYADAVNRARQCAELQKQLYGPTSPDYGQALANLGIAYFRTGDYEDAEAVQRQALAVQSKNYDRLHPNYGDAINSLTNTLNAMATDAEVGLDFPRAIALRQQVVQLHTDLLGPQYWTVTEDRLKVQRTQKLATLDVQGQRDLERANDLTHQADDLAHKGLFADAIKDAQQAATLYQQRMGEMSVDYVNSLRQVAALTDQSGDHDGAHRLNQAMLDLIGRVLGKDHGSYLTTYTQIQLNRASALEAQGDLKDAVPTRLDILNVARVLYPRENWNIIDAEDALYNDQQLLSLPAEKRAILLDADRIAARAATLTSEGKFTDALPLAQQVLQTRTENLPPRDRRIADAEVEVGLIYADKGDYLHAAEYLQRGGQHYIDVLGKDHPRTTDAGNALDNALLRAAQQFEDQHDFSGAQENWRHLVTVRSYFNGPDSWQAAQARAFLDDCRRMAALNPDQLKELTRSEDLVAQGEAVLASNPQKQLLFFRQALEIHKQILGEDDISYADLLDQIGGAELKAADYVAASDDLGRCADLGRRLTRPEDPENQRALDDFIFALTHVISDTRARGNFSTLILLDQKMLDAVTALYGPHNWRATDARNELEVARKLVALTPAQKRQFDDSSKLEKQGEQLAAQNKYAQAIAAYWKVMQTDRQLFGPTEWEAIEWKAAGDVYLAAGDEAHARQMYAGELELYRTVLGESHPRYVWHVATIKLEQARIALNKRDFTGALAAARQALTARVHMAGRNFWGVDEVRAFLAHINNVAQLDETQWKQLDEADALEKKNPAPWVGAKADVAADLKRAIQIRRQLLGNGDEETLGAIQNAGDFFREAGDFAESERRLRNAEIICRQLYGDESPHHADMLENLGRLYLAWGEAQRGISLISDANRILSDLTLYAEGTPDEDALFTHTANSTAEIFDFVSRYLDENIDDPAKSESTASDLEPFVRQQAASIQNKAGAEFVHADLLVDLGNFYRFMGDFPRAEATLKQSQAEAARMPGGAADLLMYSISDSLGKLYLRAGNPEKALATFLDAQQLLTHETFNRQGLLAANMQEQALAYAAGGKLSDAVAMERGAMDAQEKELRRVIDSSSESEMREDAKNAGPSLELLLAMTRDNASAKAADIDEALNWTLRRKAIVLNTLFRLRDSAVAAERDPKLADQLSRLRALRQQIINLETKPRMGRSPGDLQDAVANLQADADALQAQVNQQLSARHSTDSEVDLRAVRAKLPAGAALIEMVRARTADFKATGKAPFWTEAHYFAFVLHADPAAPVVMLDLGPAGQIDASVQDLRNELRPLEEDDSEKNRQVAYIAKSTKLYDQLFKTGGLAAALGNARQIYIAPDGDLNRIPFEALADADGKYLVERGYAFAYLSGGQDLLRPQAELGRGTVVFADPDYDLDLAQRPDEARVALAQLEQNQGGISDTTVTRGVHSGDLRGHRFGRLSATTREAADVNACLRNTPYGPVASPFERDHALADVFKAVKSPRVLHVATHGYYQPDDPTAAQNNMRISDDPLLRSVLAFAGANAPPGDAEAADDGLVTAEEVSLMDLRGTDLVVLSACETGLGDVQNNEGVYGLRRAFLNAGARTLLTSLFEVPSDATEQLMRDFYKSLGAGKNKLASLHEAQTQMIARHRKEGGAAHPFYWAGFILVGDPT